MAKRTDLVLKGFKRLKKALNPRRARNRLGKFVKEANEKLGQWMVDEIRRNIREGSYARNTELTRILKESSRPLVDHGGLLGSTAYELSGPWAFEVGVNRKAGAKQIGGRGTGGKAQTGGSGGNVAAIVHGFNEEGITIDVTDQMRAYFRFLAHHTRGRVKPLAESTTSIRIRPRPYLKDAVYSKRARMKVQEEWLKAIRRTFEPR